MELESSQCPRCACWHSRVVETRVGSINGHPIRMRVRVCRYCHLMFRTKEIVDPEVKLPPRSKTPLREPGPSFEEPVREDIRVDPPGPFFFPPT